MITAGCYNMFTYKTTNRCAHHNIINSNLIHANSGLENYIKLIQRNRRCVTSNLHTYIYATQSSLVQ